jgi:hypothetical protein
MKEAQIDDGRENTKLHTKVGLMYMYCDDEVTGLRQ